MVWTVPQNSYVGNLIFYAMVLEGGTEWDIFRSSGHHIKGQSLGPFCLILFLRNLLFIFECFKDPPFIPSRGSSKKALADASAFILDFSMPKTMK